MVLILFIMGWSSSWFLEWIAWDAVETLARKDFLRPVVETFRKVLPQAARLYVVLVVFCSATNADRTWGGALCRVLVPRAATDKGAPELVEVHDQQPGQFFESGSSQIL